MKEVSMMNECMIANHNYIKVSINISTNISSNILSQHFKQHFSQPTKLLVLETTSTGHTDHKCITLHYITDHSSFGHAIQNVHRTHSSPIDQVFSITTTEYSTRSKDMEPPHLLFTLAIVSSCSWCQQLGQQDWLVLLEASSVFAFSSPLSFSLVKAELYQQRLHKFLLLEQGGQPILELAHWIQVQILCQNKTYTSVRMFVMTFY